MLNTFLQHPRRFGVACLVSGTLFVAVGDASVKWLSSTYPTLEITFIRCVGGMVLILAYVFGTGRLAALRTRNPHWHAARALLLCIVMVGVFYALGQIPMIEVEAIGHAAPFFVALLAPVVLHEKVSTHNWLAIGFGFLGVIIILRPDPSHFNIAHLYMFACAFAYALLILIARFLTATESVVAINFYIYPLTTLVTGLLGQHNWVMPTPFAWLLLVVFTVCNTSAVLLFLTGLRHVDATIAATLDYFTLVWVLALSVSIWGEYPDPVSSIGILFIVASGVYVVRHSTRKIDESIVQTTDH